MKPTRIKSWPLLARSPFPPVLRAFSQHFLGTGPRLATWEAGEGWGSLSAQVGACTLLQVSVMEDGNIIKDSNVVLEIPAPTTIAYSVIELYVRADGQFGECASAWGSGGGLSHQGGIPHFTLRLVL